MRIGQYANTKPEELEAKAFNIFFGFSLGNKYFTPDHVRSYMRWGFEHTKEKLAVLIPDKIQAVNYEVKNEYSPARAMSVALRKGVDLENTIRGIAAELMAPESKLEVLHWQDIEDDTYRTNHAVIMKAFEQDSRFRKTLIEMVKEVPHFGGLGLTEDQYVRLAQYILEELPVLIAGFTVRGIHYNLLPYPGFANLDYLALDLQEGTSFLELTEQLQISDKLRLLELHVD